MDKVTFGFTTTTHVTWFPTTERRSVRNITCVVQNSHKIVIVGAGLAGLSLCYHLINTLEGRTHCRITLVDPQVPGKGGASAVAAGLVHPFSPRSKLAWCGQEAFQSARKLIQTVEAQTNQKVVSTSGIMRLSLTQKQHEAFKKAEVSFPSQVQLLDNKQLEQYLGCSSTAISGLLQREAFTINTSRYLSALWDLCQRSGQVEWKKLQVNTLQQILSLDWFQHVVICAGANSPFIQGLERTIPILPCFGRNFKYHFKHMIETKPLLKIPVICGKYLIPQHNAEAIPEFIGGATFEGDHDIVEQLKDDSLWKQKQQEEVEQTLQRLVPHLFTQLYCSESTGGFRALPKRTEKGSIPVVDRAGSYGNSKIWIYTGLGSRGVLYHAWLSEKLAKAIVADNSDLLPREVRPYS